jgi:hypothetical protein
MVGFLIMVTLEMKDLYQRRSAMETISITEAVVTLAGAIFVLIILLVLIMG